MQNVLGYGSFISIAESSCFLTGANIFGLFSDTTSFSDLGRTLKLKFFTRRTTFVIIHCYEEFQTSKDLISMQEK